jgi:aspartyl-tRNA(Asn)/glutamyl-tRNA(Gln) amidotransferase subunit C
MEVNDLLIDNLAKLSHLSFSEQERKEIRADLQEMISFIEKLKEVNTDGVAPLLHMSSNVNMLREDVVQGSVSREEALKNAPETDGTFFKVPKVIRK